MKVSLTWNSPIHKREAVPGKGSQTSRINEALQSLRKIIKEEKEEDVLFLWTGGKEAQVIADMLLYEIGENEGESPVPFGIIDTGNQFEEIYDFRKKYLASDGDKGAETVGPFLGIGNKALTERYDSFIENIINNSSDPRGYHGSHSGEWKCPECGENAELIEEKYIIECGECGEGSKLKPVQRQNLKPEEWGVPESCGALKVEPLKRFVEDHGFDVLITGLRGSDMIAGSENQEIEVVEQKNEPTSYTRVNPLKNWSEENVWAYLKMESVSYPVLYDQGYRHTDSKCCTDSENQASEYGEGGRDAEKQAAKKQLQDMGYI